MAADIRIKALEARCEALEARLERIEGDAGPKAETATEPAFKPVHKGFGRWQVEGPEGDVAPENGGYLSKSQAQNIAQELNGA